MENSQAFVDRLMQAIRQIGRTEVERAAKLGYTVRQIDNWGHGKGAVNMLERLEQAGVIHLNDGSCPCSRQVDETQTVT